MSKYKKILDELISTAFKIGGDHEIAEALNSDENDLDEKKVASLILELDKSRIKEIRTKHHDEGHKKGKAETLAAFEKDLREKFNVSDLEKQGLELIEAIIEKQGSKSSKELDDDAVKRSKTYQTEKLQWEKKLEDLKKEMEDKVKATEAGFQKEKTFSKASEKALAILDALKPVLSEDPQKALRQKQILLNELKGFDFSEVNGELVILKDGKPLEDEHGHSVKFDALVKNKASEFFDFQKSEGRTTPSGSGSGDGGSGAGKGKYSGVMPKTEAEYMAVIADDKVALADRLALKEAWAAQQQQV